MAEFLNGDRTFEESPAMELDAWRQILVELQREWHQLKARYQLYIELENEQRAAEMLESARQILEAGGRVKAQIGKLENLPPGGN